MIQDMRSDVNSSLNQREGIKKSREHAEAEANAREIRLLVRHHQQPFTCHIDGCKKTSAGPTLKEYGGQAVWDWHQPTELALCTAAFAGRVWCTWTMVSVTTASRG
jgi:hypothetical protein